MIQANELRIGNWVYIDWLDIDTGKWHQKEHEIAYRDFWNLENGNELVKQSYNPIPLTEEWLVKLGFEKRKEGLNDFWGFGENPITKDWMIGLTWIHTCDSPFYRNGHHVIKYVHQLQNLYFALTGEELKLNNGK